MELVPNSAIGTFNYAHSFWRAGRALLIMEWEQGETHPDSPIEFLHWHAIELFLKAFLLSDGLSEDELRRLMATTSELLPMRRSREAFNSPRRMRASFPSCPRQMI